MMDPWTTLSHNPIFLRAMEVAMVGDHSLRVIGHPQNGSDTFGDLLTQLRHASVLDGPKYAWTQPCGCGGLGDYLLDCSCSSRLVFRIQRRLNSQVFDINVELPTPRERDLQQRGKGEELADVLVRVQAARPLVNTIGLDLCLAGKALLKSAMDKLGFTLQRRDAILPVARSIAALDHCDRIRVQHLAEAIQYQNIPRPVLESTP